MEGTLDATVLTMHLPQRPIASIFAGMNPIDQLNLTTLKFMCILDYHTIERNLYARIVESSNQKLLQQLLQFNRFDTFKYYDYQVIRKIGRRVLQCKFCELIGPYGCILTHMAINHDTHIGLKICNYCDREELRMHFYNNTIDECYKYYIQRFAIEIEENVCGIVADFYNMLKELSGKLNLSSTLNHNYAASKCSAIEKLGRSYGHSFPQEITVFHPKTRIHRKSIQSSDLEREFGRVISHFYGGNNASRLLRGTQSHRVVNNDVIAISSDDDDDDGRPTQAKRSKKENDKPTRSQDSHEPDDLLMPMKLIKRERTLSNQSTPIISSSDIPTTSQVKDRRLSNLPTTNASASCASTSGAASGSNDSQQNENIFASYVTQRLANLPELVRRRLEITIQEDIVHAEREVLNNIDHD